MKRNAKNEVRSQSVVEIAKRIADLKKKIALLAINRYTKPSKNSREASNMRRDVAILSSILKEKGTMEGIKE